MRPFVRPYSSAFFRSREKEYFTLDSELSELVRDAFVKLFVEGLVTRTRASFLNPRHTFRAYI